MTHPLSFAQAFLFVPANRPDRFAKSLATRAHAVIVDLEDAVPLSDKDAARDAIRRELAPFLKQCPERIVVRIKLGQACMFVLRHQCQHGAHAEFALVHGGGIDHRAQHVNRTLVDMGDDLHDVAQLELMGFDHLQQSIGCRVCVAA